ncbi:SixA phosphatase family protein [Streptomyces griseoruber]|uniref:SixA phosphatase family protein n=1 Tax=Streptomyces griseoruber TaxID=1943 RepID=UPI0006E3294D|nr:hypothetical protein [Streptomyces griseoruber]
MSPQDGPPRRLVVLRHAKSDWPGGVPDHERPLAETGCVPDLALVSTAVRARQTWQLASAEWDAPPPVRHDPRLYAAEVPELLDVVRETPAGIGTLLLVAHNPGLEELVLELAGDDLGHALDDVRLKFPTSAIAVLAWHGPGWHSLSPGTALLTSVIVPRGKKGHQAAHQAD